MTQPLRDTDALLATFAERAGALGVAVHRVGTIDELADTVASRSRELAAERPVVVSELIGAAPALMDAIADAGVRFVSAGAPAESRDAPLGLSLARLAVAETGSVLLAESALDDRGVGLLVAAHLVVCLTSVLVPSLDEAASVLRELAMRPGGSYATLVTGPSRTADIERVLTVGVQGPAKLIVVFVDELR